MEQQRREKASKELGEKPTLFPLFQVSVIDTGVGIPKSQHTNLFQPFFQGNNKNKGERKEERRGGRRDMKEEGDRTIERARERESLFPFTHFFPSTSNFSFLWR